MGSKHASIHLLCDDSTALIARLAKTFQKAQGPNEKDLAAIELIRAFANKNIENIEDPAEKAQREAEIDFIMEDTIKKMWAREPAVIVVREHFVSIYWYDRIRCENLQQELLNYSFDHKLPALGVAVYDDSNFQIYAVCNIGTEEVRGCRGEYFFDHEDIRPVKAEDICEVINSPFLLAPLQKTLSCTDGETMAETFERETGIPILMTDEECTAAGMKLLHKLPGASIFSELE